jgi:O-6-methylguanine DNA methyltransferase
MGGTVVGIFKGIDNWVKIEGGSGLEDNSKLFIAQHEDKWFGVVVDDKDRLQVSAFSNNRERLVKHLSHLSRNNTPIEKDHWLIREMVDVYNGKDSSRRIEMDFRNVSGFQRNVYEVLKSIPTGKVTTYGSISNAIGSGPRAVGTAVASNPYAPFIPCHRVIPADMTIGNYSMNGKPDCEGSDVKRQLLEKEGVVFNGDKIQTSCLWKPRV